MMNLITRIKLNYNLLRLGTPKRFVEAVEILDHLKFKDIKVDPKEEYYVYQGPPAERDFCVFMLKIDKVFSRTEIDTLSTLMGYDVFEYQPGPIMKEGGPGGPNCKHRWRRFRGKFIISGNVPTNRQIDVLVNKSVFLSRGYSILPIDIQSQLILKPESGTGYQEVTFEMIDGSFITATVENGAYVNGIDIMKIKSVK